MHRESHMSHRIGWLRAAVLGANDGIVSTSSLVIGVASANATQETVLLTGVAGLVAGAMSMAAGEYVSVSSQADTESADLAMEQASLSTDIDGERDELARIYQARGLSPELARQVAERLMAEDALAAHARDDIGISSSDKVRPVQAAVSSAATFSIGAGLPLIVVWSSPHEYLLVTVGAASVVFLGGLGALAARAGGAPMGTGAVRVAFWGLLAMGLTAAVGWIFGVSTS